jgi:hypothetical protein
MKRICELFDERKIEIDFYFSVIKELIIHNSTVKKIDSNRFTKILKANILLMSYNLIEYCIINGFNDIYNAVNNCGASNSIMAEELRDIWSNHKILKAHKDTVNLQTYGKQVKEIIIQVLSSNPIFLTLHILDISGNLDARQIKNLLKIYKISFLASKKVIKVIFFW